MQRIDRTGVLGLAAVTSVLALLPGPAAASASTATPAPIISPAPGTPDASPKTQISIWGIAPRKVEGVKVTGSASGSHRGRLRDYSADAGASFVLSKPLTTGERVAVVVRVVGRKAIRFSFGVEHPGAVLPVLNIGKLQPAKLDHFVTAPSLLAPRITIEKHTSSLHGDVFLTPLPSPVVHPESNNSLTIDPVGPGGPMIIDPHGDLVWFDQLASPNVAANFRPQVYRGHEVLTWWQGGVTPSAFGIGEGVIASTSYRTIRTVHAGNGYAMDIHEFDLTPAGDAIFTVYSPILVHLAGTPAGKLSPLLDSIVQEVDIRTGLVVWEWHAYGHIPLADSDATPATSASYDAYHVNSIELLPDDRLLISARDTSAVYELDQRTGRSLWTLGGKASSFRMEPGAEFHFQHDAQLLPGDKVSMFDDEAGPPAFATRSRGLILALDQRNHTARLVRHYTLPTPSSLADSEGSVEALPSGGAFVGYGSTPFFSQFSATGALQFEASLPVDDGSYREYTYPWSATPRTRPLAAARRASGSSSSVEVYASWNGASTVARWQVVAGGSTSSTKVLASAPRSGFETRLAIHSSASRFAVRAVNSRGQVIATSSAITPSP